MSTLRPHFYRALRADGRLQHGYLPAIDRHDLEGLLREDASICLLAWPLPIREQRLPPTALTECCFQLGQLLGAGLPLLEALSICREESGNRQLQACLHRLTYDLRQGLPLSQALQRQSRHFDLALIAAIHAAEHSGDLAAAFNTLHGNRRWLEQFRRQLGQDLLAPLFGGLATLGACLFLIYHTGPLLQQFAVAQGLPLPTATRWLLQLAPALQSASFWLPVLPALLILALLTRLTSIRRPLHRLLLGLPLLGRLWLQFELARFCRTLGMLYDAGLPLLAALDTGRELLHNRHLHAACGQAIERIREGRSLSAAFADSRQFPSLLLHLLAVGEHAGRLGECLHTLAEHFTRQAQMRMQQIQSLLPPLLTLLLGSLLIFTTWSIFAPLNELIGLGGGGR
ncbi:MAG: type II secretion system F family protein [Azonexus sp.]|nr:type II secretion system F family protein [Azonexus sp.]MCK6413163.1 type II secretion system F family protein [Azonexus sp.]